jgi:hypothetical protein
MEILFLLLKTQIIKLIKLVFDDIIIKLIAFLFGVFCTYWCKRIKKWKLRRVLEPKFGTRFVSKIWNDKKTTVNISIPKFKGEILKRKRDVALFDELQFGFQIESILSSIGIHSNLIDSSSGENYDNNSEIHIGGPVSNYKTNYYINNYFKDFKWIITDAHKKKYVADENLKKLDYSFIKISTNDEEGVQIGENFYNYKRNKEGWAIIAKIKIDTNPKVVHLLFGCGANGTHGAVEFFIKNYKEIYKVNKSKQYIGIFKVNKDGIRIGEINWLDTNLFLK